MKCSACAKNECDGKYENREKCKSKEEGIECSCYCKRTKGAVIFSSLLSIGAGIAGTAVGISLTAATGGITILFGAVIAGGGTTLIISPVQKLVTKECITFTDSAKEVALGASIGAVTGPIGTLSTASKLISVTGEIGARVFAGSAAGAASGAISEGAKIIKGEEVSWGSFGKSVAIGAVAGTVGGASTSIAHSNVCKPVADVIGKPAMRVATQAGTAMATDAGVQLATTGEIDTKLMLANAAGQVACGVTAEAASGMVQKTKFYAERLDNQHIEEFNKNEPDKSKHLTRSEINDIKKGLKEMNSLNQEQLESLPKKIVQKKDRIYFGESNVHKVNNDRLAADFGVEPKNTDNRGTNRVLGKNHNGNYIYDGHIRDHKYKKVHGRPESIRNPLTDILRNDQIATHLINNDENNNEDNEKKK